jgi:hypothetical protein
MLLNTFGHYKIQIKLINSKHIKRRLIRLDIPSNVKPSKNHSLLIFLVLKNTNQWINAIYAQLNWAYPT